MTRHHAHHYLGFTRNQWELLEKEEVPRIKPLLYAFRTVLTGIHLLRTGEVEANLEVLNAWARLPFLAELMALKREGREGEPLPGPPAAYQADHLRLVRELEEARQTTSLPGAVPEDVSRAVSEWVVGVRLEQGSS